jgi:hypothetical protein
MGAILRNYIQPLYEKGRHSLPSKHKSKNFCSPTSMSALFSVGTSMHHLQAMAISILAKQNNCSPYRMKLFSYVLFLLSLLDEFTDCQKILLLSSDEAL